MPFTDVTNNTQAQTAFANASAGVGLGEPPGGLNKDDHALWVIAEILGGQSIQPNEAGVTNALFPVGHVRRYGAVCNGTTNDTTAVQRAITAAIAVGGTVTFPDGLAVRMGPVTIPSKCTLAFGARSSVVPIFDTTTLEKLFAITGDDVVVDGPMIANVTGTLSTGQTATKYLFHTTGARTQIRRCNFSNIMLADVNNGTTTIGAVVHGIYLDGAVDAVVENNRINAISGAAVFGKDVVNPTVRLNHITDTRWYSITMDVNGSNGFITENRIDGTDVLARYWGGSINMMSQTTGLPNSRFLISGNVITGIHNYGAAIRLLSLSHANCVDNIVYEVTAGSILPGSVQYIGLDRRGTAEGSPENGPCVGVSISRNILVAGTGPNEAIYLKNQYKATRDAHTDIVVSNNVIISPSLTKYFGTAIAAHGFKSGYDRLKILHNTGTVLTASGASVSGAIGVVSTQSSGTITDLTITDNSIADISTAVPSDSSQIGIYVQGYVDGANVENNTVTNFFYGVRSAASNVQNVYSLDKNRTVSCINDTLFGTAPVGGGLDVSFGAALPVTGVFRTGHLRFNRSAAVSTSNGWQSTAAGGAVTTIWASGASYVAGTWYRNSSNRAYELITAGGSTTSVEPTHTTVGQDVTAADGYTWRCRATTVVRWAPLAAMGAVVALP